MVSPAGGNLNQFLLPDLGEGLEEAELVEWCVRPGQRVEENDTLAKMETAEALVEVPSPRAGVIAELHGKPGQSIKVGKPLVTYKDEAPRGAGDGRRWLRRLRLRMLEAAQEQRESAPADKNGKGRRDAGTVVGNLDATDEAPADGKVLATPAVRRLARDLGVELEHVTGTGIGGRITAHDVEQAAGATTTSRLPATTPRRTKTNARHRRSTAPPARSESPAAALGPPHRHAAHAVPRRPQGDRRAPAVQRHPRRPLHGDGRGGRQRARQLPPQARRRVQREDQPAAAGRGRGLPRALRGRGAAVHAAELDRGRRDRGDRPAPGRPPRRRDRHRERADGPGHPQRPPPRHAGDQPPDRRAGPVRPRPLAAAGTAHGQHVHDQQLRLGRRPLRDADHQLPGGRDPRDRPGPRGRRRPRRHARRRQAPAAQPLGRPPRHRRRHRRHRPGQDHAAPAAPGRAPAPRRRRGGVARDDAGGRPTTGERIGCGSGGRALPLAPPPRRPPALDGGSMFGVVPRVLWSKLSPPDEEGRIRLAHNCLLLEPAQERQGASSLARYSGRGRG